MESAMVMWHPVEFIVRNPDATIWNGKDRKFESVENAVIFVMETLSDGDRATAIIQTDSRSIGLADIEAIYDGMKPNEGPAGESK
jgi:hypothetical protein